MAREKTQADFRKMHNATDQWGREYLVTIEIASGDPTGPINQNYTDPLNTPQKYLRVPRHAPYTVEIDYSLWVAELKERNADWESIFAEYCQNENLDVDDLLSRPPKTAKERAAFKFAGPRPQSWENVEAASKGEKKFLFAPDYKTVGVKTTRCGVCEEEFSGAVCPSCKARFQAQKMRAAKGKKPAAAAA